jgi:hypothetical protein
MVQPLSGAWSQLETACMVTEAIHSQECTILDKGDQNMPPYNVAILECMQPFLPLVGGSPIAPFPE